MRRHIVSVALAASMCFATAAAHARPTVTISRVDVELAGREESKAEAIRLKHELRAALVEAARKANFGPGDKKRRVELTARLVEFTTETRGDVLQVRCTLAGRVAGGRGARSRLSFGGNPNDRGKLEKEVLKMVARGLIARLAEIARSELTEFR